jgi:hypothetical protein
MRPLEGTVQVTDSEVAICIGESCMNSWLIQARAPQQPPVTGSAILTCQLMATLRGHQTPKRDDATLRKSLVQAMVNASTIGTEAWRHLEGDWRNTVKDTLTTILVLGVKLIQGDITYHPLRPSLLILQNVASLDDGQATWLTAPSTQQLQALVELVDLAIPHGILSWRQILQMLPTLHGTKALRVQVVDT